MRRLIFALVPLVVAASASAQIGRQRFQTTEPSAWISGGAGSQDGWTVSDGKTGSVWAFGGSTQYAASLEKNLSNGVSFGVRGTTANVPMTYTSATTTSDADVNVSQVFATVHAASPGQFHTVLEFSVGTTIYSNFKERVTNAKLAPDAPDSDFSYAFGYGGGYAFSNRFSLDVVRDYSTAQHQDVGLSAGTDTKSHWNTTRVLARIGF